MACRKASRLHRQRSCARGGRGKGQKSGAFRLRGRLDASMNVYRRKHWLRWILGVASVACVVSACSCFRAFGINTRACALGFSFGGVGAGVYTRARDPILDYGPFYWRGPSRGAGWPDWRAALLPSLIAHHGLYGVRVPLLLPALATSLVCAVRLRRVAIRDGAGRCLECGYERAGSSESVCPECGSKSPPRSAA